jgi:dienelactone hydrolase
VFAKDGWTAIAYDARSAAREDDLRAVVAYARDSGATSLVLVGGSLGASLSISMATELEVQAVVSLSAPASSFDALEAAAAIGDSVPVLVAVAEGNEPYATNAVEIADAIVSGDGHGTGMFRDHPELMDAIVAFADDEVGQA